MAQAPDGGGGAPRQNKTVKEFKGMNTQNRRNAIPEGSFAWLENIQPIGPGHLHSIPGRGESVTRIPPTPTPPSPCTDATARGQSTVEIEDRFVQDDTLAPETNLRTSWGYISSDEELWTLIGIAGCGGGNMSYNATCCQLNHFQTPSILSHPALIDPNGSLPAINAKPGSSDEPCYTFYDGGGSIFGYYPNSNTSAQYIAPGGYALFSPTAWVKKGTSIYFWVNNTVGSPNRHIVEFNAASAAFLNDFSSITDQFAQILNATDDYIYAYCAAVADSKQSIKKLSRVDGSVVDTFNLDNIGVQIMAVANDDLIYIVTNDSGLLGPSAGVYYIENFTDLVFVGNCTDPGAFSPFACNGSQFVNGSIYWGSAGISGFTVDVFRIHIACPTGSPPAPIVASAGRGSASVAAGASITASWTDRLNPSADDEIQLRPAPSAGDIGFVGAPTSTQNTDGTETGSISFPIPGGTTPGTYVFMLVANGNQYVATSPTFTVT